MANKYLFGIIILFVFLLILSLFINPYIGPILGFLILIIGFIGKKYNRESFDNNILIDIQYDKFISEFINIPNYLDISSINNILDAIIDNNNDIWHIKYLHNTLIKIKQNYDMKLIGYNLNNIDLNYNDILNALNYTNNIDIFNIILNYIFIFDIQDEYIYLNNNYKLFISNLVGKSLDNYYLSYTQINDNIIKLKINNITDNRITHSVIYDFVYNRYIQSFETYPKIINQLLNNYNNFELSDDDFNQYFNISNIFYENLDLEFDTEKLKLEDINYFNQTYNNSKLYKEIVSNIFDNDRHYYYIIDYYMNNNNIFDLETLIDDDYSNIPRLINKLQKLHKNYTDKYNYDFNNLSNHLWLHLAYQHNLILNDSEYQSKLKEVQDAIRNIIKKNKNMSLNEQYKLNIIINDINQFDINNTHKTYYSGLSQNIQNNILQLQSTNKILQCDNLSDCIDKNLKNITFDNLDEYDNDEYLENLLILYHKYEEQKYLKIFSDKLNLIRDYILDKIKNDYNIKILVDHRLQLQKEFKEHEFNNMKVIIKNMYKFKQSNNIISIENLNTDKQITQFIYNIIDEIYTLFIDNHLNNKQLIEYFNKIVNNYIFIKIIGNKEIIKENIILDNYHKTKFLIYIFNNNNYINIDNLNNILEHDCQQKLKNINNEKKILNQLTNEIANELENINKQYSNNIKSLNNCHESNELLEKENIDLVNIIDNSKKENIQLLNNYELLKQENIKLSDDNKLLKKENIDLVQIIEDHDKSKELLKLENTNLINAVEQCNQSKNIILMENNNLNQELINIKNNKIQKNYDDSNISLIYENGN